MAAFNFKCALNVRPPTCSPGMPNLVPMRNTFGPTLSLGLPGDIDVVIA